MSRVALLIVYNHPHEENIPVLEKIYGKRFSDIYHLVPCYRGDQENVIPVYSHSHNFHHYFPQALPRFFDTKYDHYLFIADDLILNPRIDENNYAEFLHLDRHSCFFPGLKRLEKSKDWYHIKRALEFRRQQDQFTIEHTLPSCSQAKKKLEYFGLGGAFTLYQGIHFCSFHEGSLKLNLRKKNMIFDQRPGPEWSHRYLGFLWRLLGLKRISTDYPLMQGVSDMICVSADSIKAFCHFCGVFSSVNLFVEAAIPSSLFLCAKKITYLKDIGMEAIPDMRRLPSEYPPQLCDLFERKCKENLQLLFEQFPQNLVYVHPIKISECDTRKIMEN